MSWPSGSQDAIGQAVEFLVWAALINQSGGRLHVFLPQLDRGIDAVVHRLDDGAYLALQVKGKSAVHGAEATIAVYEKHLFTPDQLVIGVRIEGGRLGPYALVADASTFEKKAGRINDRGRITLVADMPTEPISGHKWSEDLVPSNELAARLGATGGPAVEAVAAEPVSDQDGVMGLWGELEVVRRLAMLEDCGLFRPFPDNEANEILVRRLASGRTLGVQVKTEQLADAGGYRNVLVNKATFVPSPTTYVVALGWILLERRFHETCLVVPGDALPSLAPDAGPYYELHFRPSGSAEPSRLDRYRVPLASLADAFAGLLDRTE